MSPFELFDQWFSDVQKTSEIEPNAMVLSTISAEGRPTSRVVLLKRLKDQVFYFFTNYTSDKSKALAANPYAALNFHWRLPSHRQIRIEGKVIKASAEISEEYFRTRPRGSQIGAWASPQSQKIESRAVLEEKVKLFEKQFEHKEVPLPDYWGGWGIVPERMEFWEGKDNRLHVRRLFIKNESQWTESLLAP